ncbi:MAG: tail fiber protein [Alphaproteobacteria bacterium]|nr:tail fiber protein [Alphaproteobacteria bacterium]
MDAFYGMIASFGFNFAPVNWAFCSGQTVSISQNQALYSLIGSYFGGDGRATFGYPDLRARVPVGSNMMGAAAGLTSFPLGTRYGIQTQELSTAHIAVHTHPATFEATGSTISVTVDASIDPATKRVPADGDYVGGQPALGTFPDMYVANNEVTGSVPLGGVSASISNVTGTVALEKTGSNLDFQIVNPLQAVNYCICENGIYPSRN